ncbi:hypothetical protein ACFE04_025219 [Oxalis oulophora]
MALLSSNPWVCAFGILGNIISFLVYLAPVTTFYRIYKKKATESFSSMPYLVALFSSMLWLYYALVKGDFLLMTINSFGCVVETIYISMYLTYATKEKRKYTLKMIVSMNFGLFGFILLMVHHLAKGSQRASILGWICVAFSVCVFAAPLTIVAKVVRTKSVEFMPFTLSFFLTISAIMWFAYGLFLKDMCIALPNVVGFFLGMVQMILYAIYKNAGKVLVEEKKLQELNTVVVVNSLGGVAEIHPVQSPPNCDVDDQSPTVKNESVEEDLGKVVVTLETNLKPKEISPEVVVLPKPIECAA